MKNNDSLPSETLSTAELNRVTGGASRVSTQRGSTDDILQALKLMQQPKQSEPTNRDLMKDVFKGGSLPPVQAPSPSNDTYQSR